MFVTHLFFSQQIWFNRSIKPYLLGKNSRRCLLYLGVPYFWILCWTEMAEIKSTGYFCFDISWCLDNNGPIINNRVTNIGTIAIESWRLHHILLVFSGICMGIYLYIYYYYEPQYLFYLVFGSMRLYYVPTKRHVLHNNDIDSASKYTHANQCSFHLLACLCNHAPFQIIARALFIEND